MPSAPSQDKPANTHCRKGRWYWEPPAKLKAAINVKSRPLGAEQSTAWALARKLNQELQALTEGAQPAGTVSWVFEEFFKTEKFQSLAKSTQTDYRWLAKCLNNVQVGERTLGEFIAMAIKPRHADQIYNHILNARGHSTAHYCARFARRVWKWAGRKEYVGSVNPWRDMELKSLPEREQVWSQDQVEHFIQVASTSKYPSIALAARVAYAFGHRKNDTLTLTWTALDQELHKTNKTKVKLPVVVSAYPELESALAIERERQKTSKVACAFVIQCELNQGAWHPDVFAHKFRELADLAGLPKDLQFRDLRATVQTELNDAGADIIAMSTHSGHKDPRMARRYARRTPEQFQRAAAMRQARKIAKNNENEASTASEPPSELRKIASKSEK